jgi:hypothetical protein
MKSIVRRVVGLGKVILSELGRVWEGWVWVGGVRTVWCGLQAMGDVMWADTVRNGVFCSTGFTQWQFLHYSCVGGVMSLEFNALFMKTRCIIRKWWVVRFLTSWCCSDISVLCIMKLLKLGNTVRYPVSEMVGFERVSDFGIPILYTFIMHNDHNFIFTVTWLPVVLH